MTETINNGNGEGKIRKVLYNEVSFAIAVIGAVVGVVLWVTGPQAQSNTAIELLKAQVTVQETTINTLTKTQQNDTKEVKSEIAGFRSEVQTLTREIVELRTIINERIPKR